MYLRSPALWCFAALFSAGVGSAGAQPRAPAFAHYGLEEGLSGYAITALHRDGLGFLWIGTQRGLDRYDGVHVRAFTRAPEALGHLRDDDITALEEDARQPGVLWIGTGQGGLSRFDPITEQFTTFTTDAASISSNAIRALHAHPEGTLWIGTADAGLNRFHPATDSFDVFRRSPGAGPTLTSDSIHALYAPPSLPGTLWIGTAQGLSILHLSQQRFEPTLLFGEAVTAMAEAGGAIWCGTDQGALYRYDLRHRRFERAPPLSTGALGRITDMETSHRFGNLLWIGTRGQGVIALDTQTYAARQFTYDMDDPASLSRADVNAVLEDDTGLLWAGTIFGLDKAILRGQRFRPRTAALKASQPLTGPSVLTLYEAPSQPGIVWVSLIREGLRRFDRRTGSAQHVTVSADTLNYIVALQEDRDGQFWLGGNYPDLFLMNRATGKMTAYPLGAPADLILHQIYEAPSQPGILWLATRDIGLLKFDGQRRAVVQRYTATSGEGNPLSSNYVWSVVEDPGEPGILWIATRYGGVNRLDTRTDAVTVFRKQEPGACLPSDDIITMTPAVEGVLWLGTDGAGLVRLDTRTGTCTTYSRPDGLPHTDVSAIFIDDRGLLWLSTSGGLSLFNPRHATFTNFTEADGLQSNVFHYQARHRNARGEIFLGGSNGFNIFHPDSIALHDTPPHVAITEVLVDGTPQVFKTHQANGRPVKLAYDENDLLFSFAALDLTRPEANRYRVMLEPLDTEWQLLEPGENSIRYSKLAWDTYTFRVIGSNSDGFWNEEGTALAFVIAPPFWAAWWFRGLALLIIGGLLAATYVYRVRQLLRVERMRLRIAGRLHDDIGANLSSIALKSEMVRQRRELDERGRRRLDEVSRTARETAHTLREMVWVVNAEYDTLDKLITKMEDVTATLLDGSLAYTFACHPQPPPARRLTMDFRQNVYFLYKEALHNVVKHAQASRVTINLSIAQRDLRLTVEDDGTGFDETRVQTGHGLKSMRQRAADLGGHLEIQSRPEAGTRLTLAVRIT